MNSQGQLQLAVDVHEQQTRPKPPKPARNEVPLAWLQAAEDDPALVGLCRGRCGKPMPPGQMCFTCATRETLRWVAEQRQRAPAEVEAGDDDGR